MAAVPGCLLHRPLHLRTLVGDNLDVRDIYAVLNVVVHCERIYLRNRSAANLSWNTDSENQTCGPRGLRVPVIDTTEFTIVDVKIRVQISRVYLWRTMPPTVEILCAGADAISATNETDRRWSGGTEEMSLQTCVSEARWTPMMEASLTPIGARAGCNAMVQKPEDAEDGEVDRK